MTVKGLFSMGCLGFLLGSFLNLMRYRVVTMLTLHTRPHRSLPYYLWLKLQGHTQIHRYSPILEVVTAFCAIVLAYCFSGHTTQLIAALILSCGLLVLSVIDIEHLLLPNLILYPLWTLGLICSLFHVFVDPITALLGSSIAYLSLWLLAALYYRITRRVGLGEGDIKLFGMLGAWLGWAVLPTILLIAALSGTVFAIGWIVLKKHNYHTPIPFGPFLAMGGWLSLLAV